MFKTIPLILLSSLSLFASENLLSFEEKYPEFKPVKVVEVKINKEISFAAENLNLKQALYTIAKSAGMDIVIDNDVDTNKVVSLSLSKTNIINVLDLVVNSGGCAYQIKNNIIYVSNFTEKTYSIPYIQSSSGYSTTLGGDILGSTQSSSNSINGKNTLDFKNTSDYGDFYKQLEDSIKGSLSTTGSFVLNKFTGTLVVKDNNRVIKSIDNLIEKIKASSNRQVFIEAKILEVTLNDSHQLGIDWSNIPAASDFIFQQSLGLAGSVAGVASYSDKNINLVLTALNTAGNVDALSNPKIKVISGQSALISSGKIVPFWEKEVTYTASSTPGVPATPVVTYTRRDVLDGLSLGVMPVIKDDGTILLNVTPITSNIENTVNLTDPSTSGDDSIIASAPILNIKEAGTVIQAKNNELVLIGGLISKVKKSDDKSVPFLSDIPYIGNLFKQINHTEEKRELVILLKLNII